jgi:hypothetical protein
MHPDDQRRIPGGVRQIQIQLQLMSIDFRKLDVLHLLERTVGGRHRSRQRAEAQHSQPKSDPVLHARQFGA